LLIIHEIQTTIATNALAMLAECQLGNVAQLHVQGNDHLYKKHTSCVALTSSTG